MVKELWTPDQIWRPYDHDYEVEAPIQRAVERMNGREYGELVNDLRSRVEYYRPDERYEQGMAMAVLDGGNPEAYSTTDALVLFNPFANGATDNMLIRSEFVRLCAEESEVRDEDGKLLPVVMVASPSQTSELHLSQNEELEIKESGNFSDVAEKLLIQVRHRGFGRIALAGFSQGADIALSAAESAFINNLDVTSVNVGDPAGVIERNYLKLGLGFLQSSSSLQPNVLAGGVRPNMIAQGLDKEIQPYQNDMMAFIKGALNRTNRTIWQGLAKDDFAAKTANLLNHRMLDKIVVAWGEDSTVTPAQVIREQLAGIVSAAPQNSDKLVSIEVANAQHGWGDNLLLLARLYLK